MKMTKLVSLLLALTMLFCLAACGTGDNNSASKSPAASQPAASQPETEAPSAEPEQPDDTQEPEEAMYPIVSDDLELSIWGTFKAAITGLQESYADCYGFKRAEERTGVSIEWILMSPPDANQKFPISIASGDMPDIYRCFPQWYNNLQDACDENIIIDLTDKCPEYAPDYYEMLTSDNARYLDGIDDNGKIFAIWHYKSAYSAPEGIAIRQDWLNKLDMEIPTTLDEMEAYLEGIKTEFGCTTALFVDNAMYTGGRYWMAHAFNVGGYNKMDNPDEFMQIDGQVMCSYTQDGFKQYLLKMNDWYKKGYISSDFPSTEMDIVNNAVNIGKITGGDTGCIWSKASSFADYKDGADDPDFELVGIGNINAVDGGKTHFSVTGTRAARYGYSITTACDNWDVAMKWINFFYTPEGIDLYNYGVEGETFTRDGDKIVWTDLVTSKQGLEEYAATSVADYYSLYEQAFSFEDPQRLYAFYDDAMVAAIEAWTNGSDGEYMLPLGVSMNTEETEAFNKAITEIRTFVGEKIGLYIMGDLDIEAEWNDFVAQIEQLGVQDCIDAKQGALDRYNKR